MREAIRFLEAADVDAVLRERLRSAGLGLDIEALSALGADAGYTFTPDELRRAFINDWRMRRRFFGTVTERKAGSGPERLEEP